MPFVRVSLALLLSFPVLACSRDESEASRQDAGAPSTGSVWTGGATTGGSEGSQGGVRAAGGRQPGVASGVSGSPTSGGEPAAGGDPAASGAPSDAGAGGIAGATMTAGGAGGAGSCLDAALPSEAYDLPSTAPVTYLALGDSYTIGESVASEWRWPVQLAGRLREVGLEVADPLIIARTGWTTTELDSGIDAADPQGPYSLVSLLIGVNDQYRGYPLEGYEVDFRAMLDRAIGFAGGDPERVVVLSIPDWGATPFASGRDRASIAAEIDAFNAANAEITSEAGARYVDVTAASRSSADDLVAPDGLHPSARQYAIWACLAFREASAALVP